VPRAKLVVGHVTADLEPWRFDRRAEMRTETLIKAVPARAPFYIGSLAIAEPTRKTFIDSGKLLPVLAGESIPGKAVDSFDEPATLVVDSLLSVIVVRDVIQHPESSQGSRPRLPAWWHWLTELDE